MVKTRDLFKKIRDTKGTFHAMDLTEAEDIKKKWQEYRRTVQKKIFMTQIITMVYSPNYSQTSWNAKSSGP